MNNDNDLLHQPHPIQQKPTSSFKSLKPLALLAAVLFIAVVALELAESLGAPPPNPKPHPLPPLPPGSLQAERQSESRPLLRPSPKFSPAIVPNDTQVAVPPEELVMPTRVGQAPGSTWNTYTDPNIGFSFSYPANWTIDAPAKLPSFEFSTRAYAVILYNYNNVVVKRDDNPDEMRIDIWVLPKIDKAQSLAEWVSQEQFFPPGTVRYKMSNMVISGMQARRWIAQNPITLQEEIVTAVDQGDRVYLFIASQFQ